MSVSEICEACLGECKGQGPDVAGPRAYCLALLEPVFDVRTSEGLRGANEQFRKRCCGGFSLQLQRRAHNL